MALFDVICEDCLIIVEDVNIKIGDECTTPCPECGKVMSKKPHVGSFELKYNNKTDVCDWQGNTSRYWEAYKKEKAAGKNVKPAGSD